MKLRTALTAALAFMFAVVALLSGGGVYYLARLAADSRAIITDNFRSLLYVTELSHTLDRLEAAIGPIEDEGGDTGEIRKHLQAFDEILRRQESNITEPGESTLTAEVRSEFERLRRIPDVDLSGRPGERHSVGESIFTIQTRLRSIHDLNSEKIIRSNEQAGRTADDVLLYMAILGLASITVGLLFLLALPRFIFDRIERINGAITEIAEGNYDLHLPIDQQEEFSRLAHSFNQMTAKLREYERSSYAQVLLEKKRLDALIDRMGEGVIGFDAKRVVIFVNDRILSLLNLKRENVIGKYGPDIAVGNMLFAAILQSLDRGDEETEPEYLKIVVGDRQKVFTSSRLNLGSGTYRAYDHMADMPVGQVVLLSDVTEFAEKDTAKTRLIATLSHELKTPTAAIDMSVGLIENPLIGSLNERQLEYLRTIRNNTLRIRRLIDDMIDLAKIDSGIIDLHIEEVDPRRIVATAVDGVRLFLENKKIEVLFSVETPVPSISADIDKAIWGLTNLLTNAIRFAPAMSSIEIGIEEEDENVMIAVSDQGIGVPAEIRERLFDRYTRHGTENADGTGLGLAIVREFMEAMGGRLDIDDDYTSGSRFVLTFRRVKQEMKTDRRENNSSSSLPDGQGIS